MAPATPSVGGTPDSLSLETQKRIERREFCAKREGEVPSGTPSDGGTPHRLLLKEERVHIARGILCEMRKRLRRCLRALRVRVVLTTDFTIGAKSTHNTDYIKTQISKRILGAQENPLRSLLTQMRRGFIAVQRQRRRLGAFLPLCAFFTV